MKLLTTVGREPGEDSFQGTGMHRLVGGSRGGSKEGWATSPKKEEWEALRRPAPLALGQV